MNDSKAWYLSKTLWGAIVTVASFALSLLHVHIDPQTQQVLINQTYATVTAIGELAGTVLVVYGRIKAKKKIK